MKRNSTAFKLLCWFIDHPGIINAKTHYDLALAIDVHPGTAIYQRISCDLRMKCGLSIPCVRINDLDKYFLPYSELTKAENIRDAATGPRAASLNPTSQKADEGQSSAPVATPPATGAISQQREGA